MDTEHYISEKTTRAIVWDAILNQRDFGFHVETQADFQQQLHENNLQVVSEILPAARNYNKIFLIYNPATQNYSYAINLISDEFHKRQEKILTELFSQLPKADKIVIGQKGAIDGMIKMAGMLDVVKSDSGKVLKRLQLDRGDNAKWVKLERIRGINTILHAPPRYN